MEIDCPAAFQIIDGDVGGAVVKNLSGGGLLMWIDRAIDADSVVPLQVKPTRDITPR